MRGPQAGLAGRLVTQLAYYVTLDCEPGIEVAGEAADGAQAVHQALWRRPDVVVMDRRMPHADGIAAMNAPTWPVATTGTCRMYRPELSWAVRPSSGW
ncbi:response regulator transcription factor [Nonomuraea sp. GTA35]|uniref:response regulator transcription factor n=1 Tax=Nonomuraea sp. GTA35 TaxID=1676746 RepID=UPI0035C1854D